MAIDIRDHTSRWLTDEPSELATTEDEAREASHLPVSDVIERVNEILGYDIFEAALMAEGYRVMADEMLEIAESTLAAGYEALPPE